MKKLLEKELLEVIKSIKCTAKSGIDFVKKQAPDVVNQILKYEAVTKGICFALWIIAALMLIVFDVVSLLKAVPFFIENTNDKYCISYLFLISGVNFCSVGMLSGTMSSFQGFLKVIIAPKVFLIEYVQKMIDRRY